MMQTYWKVPYGAFQHKIPLYLQSDSKASKRPTIFQSQGSSQVLFFFCIFPDCLGPFTSKMPSMSIWNIEVGGVIKTWCITFIAFSKACPTDWRDSKVNLCSIKWIPIFIDCLPVVLLTQCQVPKHLYVNKKLWSQIGEGNFSPCLPNKATGSIEPHVGSYSQFQFKASWLTN